MNLEAMDKVLKNANTPKKAPKEDKKVKAEKEVKPEIENQETKKTVEATVSGNSEGGVKFKTAKTLLKSKNKGHYFLENRIVDGEEVSVYCDTTNNGKLFYFEMLEQGVLMKVFIN